MNKNKTENYRFNYREHIIELFYLNKFQQKMKRKNFMLNADQF